MCKVRQQWGSGELEMKRTMIEGIIMGVDHKDVRMDG